MSDVSLAHAVLSTILTVFLLLGAAFGFFLIATALFSGRR